MVAMLYPQTHLLIPQLTFKNEATGEYQFYYLNFKATPPGVISTIEMVTVVRQVTSGCVNLENPLPTNLLFTTECRSPDIHMQPQFSVSALSMVSIFFVCLFFVHQCCKNGWWLTLLIDQWVMAYIILLRPLICEIFERNSDNTLSRSLSPRKLWGLSTNLCVQVRLQHGSCCITMNWVISTMSFCSVHFLLLLRNPFTSKHHWAVGNTSLPYSPATPVSRLNTPARYGFVKFPYLSIIYCIHINFKLMKHCCLKYTAVFSFCLLEATVSYFPPKKLLTHTHKKKAQIVFQQIINAWCQGWDWRQM